MGVICVPAEEAQGVLDSITDAGITAVLNFAPVQLNAEAGVKLKTMDLAISFESLSYSLPDRKAGPLRINQDSLDPNRRTKSFLSNLLSDGQNSGSTSRSCK